MEKILRKERRLFYFMHHTNIEDLAEQTKLWSRMIGKKE